MADTQCVTRLQSWAYPIVADDEEYFKTQVVLAHMVWCVLQKIPQLTELGRIGQIWE